MNTTPAPAATLPDTGTAAAALPTPPAAAAPGPAKAKKAGPAKAAKVTKATKAVHPPARADKAPGAAPVAAKTSASKPAKAAKAPAASAVPAPARKSKAAWPVASAKKAKAPAAPARPKAKLVRDSFTMPQADFDLIATLKDRALGFKRPTKKSELLRAGLQVLAGLKATELKAALERLAPLKTGRPKKDD